MERYTYIQMPHIRLIKIPDFEKIASLFRDSDRRHVRNLVDFLIDKNSSELFLGGSVIDPTKPLEYEDVDLLAVYNEEQNRLNDFQRLTKYGPERITPTGINARELQIGKSTYFVKLNSGAQQYLNMDIDQSFLLEPFRESPSLGVISFGAPIELCLSSKNKFERKYKRL